MIIRNFLQLVIYIQYTCLVSRVFWGGLLSHGQGLVRHALIIANIYTLCSLGTAYRASLVGLLL